MTSVTPADAEPKVDETACVGLCGLPPILPTLVVRKPFVFHSFDEMYALDIDLRARRPRLNRDRQFDIWVMHTRAKPGRESKILAVAGGAFDAAMDTAKSENRLWWQIDDIPEHSFTRREGPAPQCQHITCTAYHACAGCFEINSGCWTATKKVVPEKLGRRLVVPLPTKLYEGVKVLHNFQETRAALGDLRNNYTMFDPIKKEENTWLMWMRDELCAIATREYSEALCRAVPYAMEGHEDDENQDGRLIDTAGFVPHHTFSRRDGASSTAECGHLICASYHACEGCYKVNPGCHRVK